MNAEDLSAGAPYPACSQSNHQSAELEAMAARVAEVLEEEASLREMVHETEEASQLLIHDKDAFREEAAALEATQSEHRAARVELDVALGEMRAEHAVATERIVAFGLERDELSATVMELANLNSILNTSLEDAYSCHARRVMCGVSGTEQVNECIVVS